MQRWIRLAFWAALALAFAVAIWPKPPSVPLVPNDKVQHIFAFLTLAALGSAAYPRAPLRLGLGLLALGAAIEAVQAIPVLNRDAEWLDWVADAAAVIVVLVAVQTARRLRRKPRD